MASITLGLPALASWDDVQAKAAAGGLINPWVTADGSAYALDPASGAAFYLGRLQVPTPPAFTGGAPGGVAAPLLAIGQDTPTELPLLVVAPNLGPGQGGGQGPVPLVPLAIGGSATPAIVQQLMQLLQRLGDALAALLGARGYLWLILGGVLVLVIARRR